MQITEKLIGQKFTTSIDPSTEWTLVGWDGNNGTQLLIGATWNQQDNRYTLNTFKLRDCRFVGQIPVL